MAKVWTKTDLKNAARGNWETGVFEPSPALNRLVELLSERFGADAVQVAGQLFTSDDSIAERLDLLESVLLALLHAPRQGIEPFAGMYIAGRLPTRQQLLNSFHPLVTEGQLDALAKRRYAPVERSSDERQRLKRLLYRVGITGDEGDACARVMAPPRPPKEHRQKSPQNRACMEAFVQALSQPDIALRRPHKTKVLRQLAEYKLTEACYRGLVQRRFQSNGLANTPANRRQIMDMSRQVGVDAQPFLRALIDS